MGSSKRLENTTTLFLRKREFGFLCPDFSLGVSDDGFLLPRSRKQLLKRSLLGAKVATRDLTGRYSLKVHCEGAVLFELPVIVAWATHRSLKLDLFLALKVRDPHALRRQLKPWAGKDVELSLQPRLAPHLQRPALPTARWGQSRDSC
jgi:hypothetical protein